MLLLFFLKNMPPSGVDLCTKSDEPTETQLQVQASLSPPPFPLQPPSAARAAAMSGRRSSRARKPPQREGMVDITDPGLSFAQPKGGISAQPKGGDAVVRTSLPSRRPFGQA